MNISANAILISVIVSGLLLELISSEEVTTLSSDSNPKKSSPGCGVPVIKHSEIPLDRVNYTTGEKIQVVCSPGYRVPYTKSTVLHLECTDSGTWQGLQGQVTSCQRIGSCPPPTEVIAHTLGLSGLYSCMPGDILPLLCEEGYMPVKMEEYIICKKDGTWGLHIEPNVTPECVVEPRTCGTPHTILNGNYELDINHLNSGYTYLPDSSNVPQGSYVRYACNKGFVLDNPRKHRLRCDQGDWSDTPPKCLKAIGNLGCRSPQNVKHASFVFHLDDEAEPLDGVFPEGSRAIYRCDSGYKLNEDDELTVLVCVQGVWHGAPLPACLKIEGMCPVPQSIENGNFMTTGHTPSQDGYPDPKAYTDGVRVYYYCQNGYRLQNASLGVLQCHNGKWLGSVPVCERRTHCDPPMDIENGNWVLAAFRPSYGIGTKIQYECRIGYKPMGATEIECQSSGYWSDYAPRCLAANKYCSEPGPVDNGVYMCRPSHCDLFKVGTEVHYVCNKDYEARSKDQLVQNCQEGAVWSGEKPVCKPVNLEAAANNFIHFNPSTLTVVIATSCGVLGLLVVVMVVVALQRRRKKPRTGRLCHPDSVPPPPPYPTPPTGLVDEPDRVALIAFADGVQVVLPSYEEAVRGRSRLGRYNSDSTRGSIRSSASRGDYRPLPSLPPSLRSGGPQIREIPADGHRDHHRNSIITTTSITTRDNLSLTLGSIDTMNISDGTSTTVTVDTASSNPSLATSQRAAAGSIESSSTNGSLATEDAPLLDQNHYNTETLRSHHSNTSDYHSHNSRCPCTERSLNAYDSLHSQNSRTAQNDSAPIAEVPEEQK